MLAPVPVTAALSVATRSGNLVIELQIRAPTPHPLYWSLSATTRSGGGVGNTHQTGVTDGASARPVASLTFRADASGIVTLSVHDDAGVEASRTCTFGPKTLDGLGSC